MSPSTPTPTFHPYTIPQPNMLVQTGSKVRITGLKSETGQKLNGLTGTALHFYPTDHVYDDGKPDDPKDKEEEEEKNENDDQNGEKIHIKQTTTDPAGGGSKNNTYKIRITNLQFAELETIHFAFVNRENPFWLPGTEPGRAMVLAGKSSNGHPALCLCEDSNGGLRESYLSERLPKMGLPVEMVRGLVEQFNKTAL